jgi:hypothetical protein
MVPTTMRMEKRRHPRIVVTGMSIDVSDGIGCWSGTVNDVSRNGLRVSDLGSMLGKKTGTYTVVASKGWTHFKFRVKPRWEVVRAQIKTMGMEIAETPGKWTEYIQTLESVRKRS